MNKKSLVFELSSVSGGLAKIKEMLRITSKQLAESAGVSEQTFSAWFKGKNPPTAEALAAWMIEYNLNINWLLTGQGEMFLSEAGAATEAKSMSAATVPPSESEAALKRENSILRELVDSTRSDLAKAEKIIALYEHREGGPQSPATSEDAALLAHTSGPAK